MFNEIAKAVVFSVSDIKKHFQTDVAMFAWLKRRILDKRIIKIKRDLYSVVDPTIGTTVADKYMIGSAVTKSSYIAYHSALEFHGIANQVYNILYVAGEERFSPFEFDGIEYSYTHSPLSEGVMRIYKGSELKVTDLERTLIDCLNNLKMSGGIEELLNALDSVSYVDEKRMVNYLEKYNTNVLFRKAGYVFSEYKKELSLSDAFFSFCKEKVDKNRYYFLREEKANSKLDKNWNLIVPNLVDLRKNFIGI